MPKVSAFINISLDGFFASPDGSMGWAHKDPADAEWNEFVAANAGSGGKLLFGRVTYEMMSSFWPSPMAHQMMPEVAANMNSLSKAVFSNTLDEASWNNTRIMPGDLESSIRQLKQEAGPDMCILGSGSVIRQLTASRLLDELQVVVNPIVLGTGKSLFNGIPATVQLKLTHSRTFGNGSVYLRYEPAAG